MLLYLIQHAEAKKEEEDPARDLTAKGRQDISNVAHYLRKVNLAVSRVFHSGKTRALSTAKILAASLKPPPGVAAANGLAPLDDPSIWADQISKMDEDLMLVGHLPHLARLAGLLIIGDPEKNVINFKMAGMVCLRRMPTGQFAVEWMVIPEII